MIYLTSYLYQVRVKELNELAAFNLELASIFDYLLSLRAVLILLQKRNTVFKEFEWEIYANKVLNNFQNDELNSWVA